MNDNVIAKTMEECGELVLACSKYLNSSGKQNESNVLDEAADTLVMITALVKYINADEDKFFRRVNNSKKKFAKYYEGEI